MRDTITNTAYSVQCDDGKNKFIVAYAEVKGVMLSDFTVKKKAVDFMNKNKKENPECKFRLVKQVRKTDFEEWI